MLDASNSSKPNELRHILLIEDNRGDVVLIQRALAQRQPPVYLHVATDGDQALDFLRRCVQGAEPRPSLILLDLNLPQMDGSEILLYIKQDRAIMSIPVVVFSSSQAEEDIARSYAHYANCYVTKPLDLDQFLTVIEAVHHFWLTVAQLPRSHTYGKSHDPRAFD